MTKAKSHTHQYKKVRLSKGGAFVYRCMLSDCPHYISPALILGKSSICPSCHESFVIDKYASQRTFPICETCRAKKNPSSVDLPHLQDESLAATLKKLGIH